MSESGQGGQGGQGEYTSHPSHTPYDSYLKQKQHQLSEDAQEESYHFTYILETILPDLIFQNIRPTPLKINTMTVVCKPFDDSIRFSIPNLKQIVLQKQEKGELDEGMTISTKGLGKNCIIFKWAQPIDNTDTDGNEKTKNISIKMFRNGSIHIVGVTRPIEALLISNYFFNFFQTIHVEENNLEDKNLEETMEKKLEETHSADPHIDPHIDKTCLTGMTESYSICMIQSNFEIDYALRFSEFREHWDVEAGDIIFNKESRHPGLQIKFKEMSTSCILFTSGKILITGATKPEHLEDVYKTVCDFINRKKNIVTQPRVVREKKIPQKRGRKRKAEHDAFYAEFDIEKDLE